MHRNGLRVIPGVVPDARRTPRRPLSRLALAQVGSGEFPGVTGDVSAGGVQLAMVGGHPRTHDLIRVTVAFDGDVVEAIGRVAYSMSRPWGALVGVAFHEAPRALFETA